MQQNQTLLFVCFFFYWLFTFNHLPFTHSTFTVPVKKAHTPWKHPTSQSSICLWHHHSGAAQIYFPIHMVVLMPGGKPFVFICISFLFWHVRPVSLNNTCMCPDKAKQWNTLMHRGSLGLHSAKKFYLHHAYHVYNLMCTTFYACF